MSIQSKILEYLKKGKSLNSKECEKLFGTQRLGAYICNLRKAGYNIIGQNEKGKNRFGDVVVWTRYKLEENT